MSVNLRKIQQYFLDNGFTAEKAMEVVRLRSQDGVLSILRWETSSPPRPDDSYWADAPEFRPTPPRVTARQFRLALLADGTTMAQVSAALDAIPDAAEREAAIVEWEYALTIKRDHPLVLSLAATFGYDTAEKINQLFRDAAAQ